MVSTSKTSSNRYYARHHYREKSFSSTTARRASDAVKNLKIIALSKNSGFANALNVGIASCAATFIMRMDPDDILLPTRIERQYDYITRNNLDVVGSNALIFQGSTGAPVGSTNFPSEHADIAKTIIWVALLSSRAFHTRRKMSPPRTTIFSPDFYSTAPNLAMSRSH
jgi:glycosyltransferase involved in cell wall biosynthesis